MMVPDDGSDDDGSTGSRRTDGWQQDLKLQEMAGRLGTTTDPLLTRMGEMGLRYERGEYFLRPVGKEEARINEQEVERLLRTKFAGAEPEEPTIDVDDKQIEEIREAAPPSPADTGDATKITGGVHTDPAYQANLNSLARGELYSKLETALNASDGIQAKAHLGDYFLLLESQYPSIILPGRDEKTGALDGPKRTEHIDDFFRYGVAVEGREIVQEVFTAMEKVLPLGEEVAGETLRTLLQLYALVKPERARKFLEPFWERQVRHDATESAEEKAMLHQQLLDYIALGSGAESELARQAMRTFDDLSREELLELREMKGEYGVEKKLHQGAKQTINKASELLAQRGQEVKAIERDFAQERRQSLKYYRRALIALASAAIFGGAAAALYVGMSGKIDKHRREKQAATQQIQRLQGEYDELHRDYFQAGEDMKKLLEGPNGRLWRQAQVAWQLKYDAEVRRADTAELDEGYYQDRMKELERQLAQRPQETVRQPLSFRDSDAIIKQYVYLHGVPTAGGVEVLISGPGCQKALENLYDRLGDQVKGIKGLTKKVFTEYYKNVARSKMKDCQQGDLSLWFK